jgi:hypothetical protein
MRYRQKNTANSRADDAARPIVAGEIVVRWGVGSSINQPCAF